MGFPRISYVNITASIKFIKTLFRLVPLPDDGSAGIDELLPWSDKMKKLCAIQPGEQGSGEDN